MASRSAIAITVGVVVAVIICAAAAMMLIDNKEDERTFKLTYYSEGDIIKEYVLTEGSEAVLMDHAVERSKRFIGWSQDPNGEGGIHYPGNMIVMDRNVSLHALILGNDFYAILLPDEQKGFTLTADPMFIPSGGSSIISFSLLPGSIEKDLVIAVNGNPMKLNAMKRIHLNNITQDQIVTVKGVHDVREHTINLPNDQRGYSLTSSEIRVHHGESYELEYRLLPGYRETEGFGIQIIDGDLRTPTNGKLLINDVRDNHHIRVTGIEAIEYGIIAGKNTLLTVDGKISDRATVEDRIIIVPSEGYEIPRTLDNGLGTSIYKDGNGYRIIGDAEFPSVLKISLGDNLLFNGTKGHTFFVCSHDTNTVNSASGYQLPNHFFEKIENIEGVKRISSTLRFNSDIILPSIYKVTFFENSITYGVQYAISGDRLTYPTITPIKEGYDFQAWYASDYYVSSDLIINASWTPKIFKLEFGNNLRYSINGEFYTKSKTWEVTIEDKITVEALSGYGIPQGYMPSEIFIKKGNDYFVKSNYVLNDLCFVHYQDNFIGVDKRFYYSKGNIHTVVNPSQINPLFDFDLENTNYTIEDFRGWFANDILFTGDTITVDKDYVLYSYWDKSY